MRYHDIKKDDMLNGEGLRCVLFVSGCNHGCKGCQNKCTWDPNSGIPFDDSAKQEIFEQLNMDYIHGLTLCGGDPLYHSNISTITDLVREVKALYPNKTVWMYTGDLWEDIRHYPVMKLIDVLIDGPFIEELRDEKYPWAGSTNQRVIDVQKSLNSVKPVLYETEKIKDAEYEYDKNLTKCISCSA